MGAPAKTRFYQPTGAGRDDYIFGSNGGLCPQTNSNKIYEKGQFANQKQRYIDTIPSIHSKSVMYCPNGTGRDSYIHASSGGFTKLNMPGEQRNNTFYSNLRQSNYQNTPKRCKSNQATRTQRADYYTKTQDFKTHAFNNTQFAYRRYQKNADYRLSRPKLKVKLAHKLKK
jgi:hypothetical protein